MSHTTIDAILCLLWTLTYTLVLIGMERYKYPLISPCAQIAIASLEFATMISLLISGIRWENHVFVFYIMWTILELAIIGSQIRQGFITKKHVPLYLGVLIIVTLLMCILVAYRGHQLFFALFNTIVGELLWLAHVRKKNYPMKPMVFVIFLSKFIADAMSVPVYFRQGGWIHNFMGVLIPVLDFVFIHTYFSRRAISEKTDSNNK